MPRTPATSTPSTDGAVALSYPELHKAGLHEWWRALAGVALVGLLGFGVAALFVVTVVGVVLSATGYGADRFADEITAVTDGGLTPATLAATLLSLWLLIPVVVLVQRFVHRLPAGTLFSVVRRFRWRYFAVTLGLAVVALALTLTAGLLVPADALGSAEVRSTANEMTATAWQFVAVVVLLVPLQAAAEEFAFRGYLMQAWGGVLGGRRAAQVLSVVGSALVFAIMHGAQEPPIFFDRFAFGVCAGILVIMTGGLEAAIGLHVVNNLVAFGAATFFGDITAAMSPTDSTWWQIPLSLIQVGSFGVLAVWASRRFAEQTSVAVVPGEWALPQGR